MGLLATIKRLLAKVKASKPKPPTPVPTPVPPPWTPTRAQLLDVQTDFCSLRDSQGRAIFTPALLGLPVSEQAEWLDRLVSLGATHVAVAVEAGYRDKYPRVDAWGDGRMSELLDLLWRCRHKHLIPIVFLTSGDSGDVNLPRIAPLCQWAVTQELVSWCVWVCGFECVKGGWTTRQFDDAALTMRTLLGPDAVIACHLSPTRLSFVSNPHEPDDPYSNDLACWYERGGVEFELFLLQVPSTHRGDVDEFGQPSWMEVAIEAADRFLPPGTPMPAADGWRTRDHGGPIVTHGPVSQGPDWFAVPRGRGRPRLCLFETVAYHALNAPDTLDQGYVRDIADTARRLGYTSFGNGLPR